MLACNTVRCFHLFKPPKPNSLELFQIWLNLHSTAKKLPAGFKIFWNDDIPLIQPPQPCTAASLRIIAGTMFNHIPPQPLNNSWAANPSNEVAIVEIRLGANGKVVIPAANTGVNRSLYFFEGTIAAINDLEIHVAFGFDVQPDLELTITNNEVPARFLLLQGLPIPEPVAAHGPFVMNSAQEIYAAFDEYQKTNFGGWNWDSLEPTHGNALKRFSKIDGQLTLRED